MTKTKRITESCTLICDRMVSMGARNTYVRMTIEAEVVADFEPDGYCPRLELRRSRPLIEFLALCVHDEDAIWRIVTHGREFEIAFPSEGFAVYKDTIPLAHLHGSEDISFFLAGEHRTHGEVA